MRFETTDVYREWLDGLRDLHARARIQARVERLAIGNPGAHRKLTHGIVEMKIDSGPGYRVYYTQRSNIVIVLLAGGDKSSQQKDIRKAIELARNL